MVFSFVLILSQEMVSIYCTQLSAFGANFSIWATLLKKFFILKLMKFYGR